MTEADVMLCYGETDVSQTHELLIQSLCCYIILLLSKKFITNYYFSL